MSVLVVTKENLNKTLETDKKILLDFYADWCAPCKMMAPVIESIAEENGEYIVGKVNVDNEGEIAQLFGISSIPYLVVIQDKKLVDSTVGVTSKEEVLQMLKK